MNLKENTRKKRIGIYGGSFNPALLSHLMVAKEVAKSNLVDEVWMIPCGLRKDKIFEIDSPTRVKILQMSLDAWMPKDLNVKINEIELKENKQIPTYILLTHFSKYYFMQYKNLNNQLFL